MRACLTLAALLCAPAMAGAQLSGSAALLSDYRFRGESLTGDRAALHASLNYDHSSGLFAGALVSNVRIDPDVIGLSAQVYGGYSRPIGERAAWEAGLATYAFPQPAIGPTYNYTEAFVGVSFDKVSSRLYYANSYFGGGPSAYLELNGSLPLTDWVSVLGHFGYLGINEPREASTSSQRHRMVDFLAGVAVEVEGFTFALSFVGTDAQPSACPAGTGRCASTAVVSISHNF